MAYGGGKFLTQNKVLPGYYFKLLSASKDSIALSDRGKVACGLELDWGAEGAITTITGGQFQKDAAKYFGYDYGADKNAPVREMFKNATHLHFYRINGGGLKASCTWARAKYSGTRGNDLTIVIAASVDEVGKYDVFTYLKDTAGNNIKKDQQRVASMSELVDNDFVNFIKTTSPVAGVYKLTVNTALVSGDSVTIGTQTYAYDSGATTAAAQATAIAALFASDTTFDVVASGADVLFTQKVAGTGAIPAVSGSAAAKITSTTVTPGSAGGGVVPIAEDAGSPLIGGTNGTVTGAAHQDFLAKLERVHYHCLVCNSTDATTIALYVAYQKRLSHECGKVAQCVVYGYSISGQTKTAINPDSYDIIVLENKVVSDNVPEHYGVFWVGGAEAGCAVNKTVQNRIYNGEFKFFVDYTQDELALKLNNGKFMFHETINTDDEAEIRVLDDVNSFKTVTEEENSNYKKNQLIRVLYQLITDVGGTFNAKWQGITTNDADGRSAFKGVIVKYLLTLQGIRAIQNVDEDRIVVEQGETKGAVWMAIPINNVVAMFQLYNEITVE